MDEGFATRLTGLRERLLDDPELDYLNSAAVFCETWLPLALVDGASESVRALAWEAAGLVSSLPGVLDPDRAERCMVAAACGLAVPRPRLRGPQLALNEEERRER
jgi:hypothetical protein